MNASHWIGGSVDYVDHRQKRLFHRLFRHDDRASFVSLVVVAARLYPLYARYFEFAVAGFASPL